MNILKKLKRIVVSLYLSCVRAAWFVRRYFFAPQFPKNKDGLVLVNLGAGVNTSAEFINIDTKPFPWVHYINDVQALPMFRTGSVDLLYASHLIEHIERHELRAVLTEWNRVLKKGGVLRFGVPDFDALIEIYTASGKNVHSIENQLLGQERPYDDHHSIWNMEYAQEILQSVGFTTIRRWDPKKVDHHDFRDKTERTVHIGGREIPISLNIEAIK